MIKSKNIVVTSFNNYKDYFYRGVNLITALHRTSFDSIDEILVYNLGIIEDEKSYLETLEKVRVIEFPSYLHSIYDGFMTPGYFAWKCFILKDAANYGENILWLDAGIAPVKSLKTVFDKIDNEKVFFVGLNEPFDIKSWITNDSAKLIDLTEKEANQLQISANIIGYNSKGDFSELFDRAFDLAKIKGIIQGPKEIHRHDQIIYSVLAYRFNCPINKIEIFAESRGILSSEQILYAHRGALNDLSGLKIKKNVPKFKFLGTFFTIYKWYVFNSLKQIIKKLIK